MQDIIDRAVNIATRNAINGTPVSKIIFIPPQNATDDTRGAFAIEYCPKLGASETPTWEK